MRTAILFWLLLSFSLITRAQFNEIMKFPYTLHNNKSNAKILDLGNNHLIFIMGNDSLFISHSYDNGSTWDTPEVVWSGDFIHSLDAIKLPTGRIIVEFSSNDAQVIYSDDNGSTWSLPISIYSTGREIKLYYSDMLYAFMALYNNLYYWSSEDVTEWSSLVRINNIAPFDINSFAFIEFATGNYTVALNGIDSDTSKIIIKNSDVLYGNWTELGIAFQGTNTITNIDGVQDTSGKFWLSFTVEKKLYGEFNKDVYYITSEDGGNNWSEPVAFAKSFKDDWNIRISTSGDNPFAVFLTKRSDVPSLPYYGKLGISVDVYPPFLQDYSTHIVDNYPNNVTVIASARAFTDQHLRMVYLTLNSDQIAEMFDDGEHNDGVAGDSIYGVTYTFNYSDFNDESHPVGFWAIDGNQTEASLQALTLDASTTSGWNFYVLRNGNTKFAVESNGVISFINGHSPLNTYDNIPVIYDAGFMMSGITNGEIWSNGVALLRHIQDYVGGTIGDTSSAVYVVKSSDPPFGESWQNWRAAVAKGAYFYDGDGDGVYNPVDLNGNGKWDKNEDCPDILGDVTVWSVYNDGVPSADRRYMDVSPQGIEIRQTTWTKYDKDFNKNVYYIRYSIVNRGTVTDTLKDVYFGLWMDNDAGYFVDDLLGCSIPTRSGYTYDSGDDEYFGGSAPAVMATLLQGPYRYTGNPDDEATNNMGKLLGVRRINKAVNDTLISFIQIVSFYPTLDEPPNNKEEARNLLLGLRQTGKVVDPCTWRLGEVFGVDCSTIDGHFMYSGDPVTQFGWINTYPNDQYQLMSTGPFDLVKDKPIDIIASYHFSKGKSSLQSVKLGLEKAQELHNHFFPDSSDENENDLPVEFNLEQNYPNPFNNTTTISYAIPNVGDAKFSFPTTVKLVVYDILGREVATLVNKKQAPGKYSVQFNGSNFASGVYFYTLQAGDFIQTKKMILLK